jgi:hypothetical protein
MTQDTSPTIFRPAKRYFVVYQDVMLCFQAGNALKFPGGKQLVSRAGNKKLSDFA